MIFYFNIIQKSTCAKLTSSRMANTFKKVWRDKKFRMHAVWQPSGAAGPKLVRYPEKSFKMRETLLLFHSKLKTVRLKVFAELVIHCHPSDAAPHSEKAGLIPGAPKTHIKSHGDNKEHLFFITFFAFFFFSYHFQHSLDIWSV